MTTSQETTSYKNLLQEHCQKLKIALPHYSVVSETANKPPFRATVAVFGRVFESNDGFSTKKQAEQNVAKITLQNLHLLPFSEGKTSSESDVPAIEISPASKVEVKKSSSTAVEENSFTARLSPCAMVAMESKLPATSPISYKNLLQERAHKLGVGCPVYNAQACDGGFFCVVVVCGQTFRSNGTHRAKKQAEQSSASVALASLASSPTACNQSASSPAMLPCSTPTHVNVNMPPTPPPLAFNLTPHSITTEVHRTVEEEVSWKNLLQEHVQQCGMKLPVYNTTSQGSGFVCCLQIGRDSLTPPSVYPNKKQAEQMAAKEGLMFLGLNPEKVAGFKGRAKQKKGWNQHRLCLPKPGERTSWIRPNCNTAPHFDSSWEETDYFWEQSNAKRRKNDTHAAHQETPAFNSWPYMSVGEIWKEKKNIVVIGNAQSSFVLYCIAVHDKCQLFCEREQCLVTLQPGHRIVGLDAEYVEQYNGKVTLQAVRCTDVLFPPVPDPVLTSCGVVLLFQDLERRSGIQVLLKRYLVSQAFINVLSALAQYFRRKIAGRPIRLDMKTSVEHIREWMLQEVNFVSAMDEASLRQMFSHMWKFNERWCKVLKPSLPKDLQELQARATEELARRQMCSVSYSEDFYRPWSLPKGNFKHRVTSTGYFIESPAECAVRELREETGIQLDTNEVECLPSVDLPHMDNLNPHCGDNVRYYLYVYTSQSLSDEEEPDTAEYANSSVVWEAEASQGERMLMAKDQSSLSPNTQSSKSAPGNSACNSDVNDCKLQLQDINTCENEQCSEAVKLTAHKGQRKREKAEDVLQEDEMSVSGPEAKKAKICKAEEERGYGEQGSGVGVEISQVAETSLADSEESKDESFKVQGAVHSESNTSVSQERRGLKRKRDSDAEGDHAPGNSLVGQEHLCQTPSGRQPSECTDDSPTPTKSPHVHGGLHEECAWLPLNEATQKSPVFSQIYNTTQFIELLSSMEVHNTSVQQ